MKTILTRHFELGPQDDKTTIPVKFTLTAAVGLLIDFAYAPQNVEPARATRLIKAELLAADLPAAPQNVAQYLPLQNLITISAAKDGHYLGNHHYKAPQQQILLSPEHSSLGYLKPDVISGQWQISLHQHCIASELVKVQLTLSKLEEHNELLQY
ncbi:hypothetical protein [Liquorilactobacillus satsumensis]|uniref:hypothetical protein n=1 Tax=Liquorilactobacillus satsumensis TaxID=259059 RepID=UPI0039EBE73E